MGILALTADERVTSVEVSEDELTVQLMDGRTISVPLAWYPRLLTATKEQRSNWRIAGGGFGIHWEQIDEDLSTEGLLRGAPAPHVAGNRSESVPYGLEKHTNIETIDKVASTVERSNAQDEKGILDHISDGEEASAELSEVIEWIRVQTEKIGTKVNKHTASLNRLIANSAKANDYKKITLLAASDMNTFSKRIEDVLPRFEQSVRVLDESYSAFVSFANPQSTADVEQISSLRGSLANMLREVSVAKQSVMVFRDSALSIKDTSPTKVLKQAATRQAGTLNGVIGNIEQVESFALKVTFLINERFGTRLEGKTD